MLQLQAPSGLASYISANFIGNVSKLWKDAAPEHRVRFQKMVFPEGISYDFGIGFGTAKLGLALEVIQEITENDSTWWGRLELNQPPSGYEPPALTDELRPLVHETPTTVGFSSHLFG